MLLFLFSLKSEKYLKKNILKIRKIYFIIYLFRKKRVDLINSIRDVKRV